MPFLGITFPWESAQQMASDTTHWLSMFVLGLILCVIAIIILLKIGGKWRVPGFLAFIIPGALILGGFIQ